MHAILAMLTYVAMQAEFITMRTLDPGELLHVQLLSGSPCALNASARLALRQEMTAIWVCGREKVLDTVRARAHASVCVCVCVCVRVSLV